VIAAKRVMKQSLFDGESSVASDTNLLSHAVWSHTSRSVTYALACASAALVIALIALAVALLK
jgi:hypothetical protein